MRRILFSTIKILISAALLYLALRKVNLYDLVSRIHAESLGWLALAIAVTFLQIFLGVLRWLDNPEAPDVRTTVRRGQST